MVPSDLCAAGLELAALAVDKTTRCREQCVEEPVGARVSWAQQKTEGCAQLGDGPKPQSTYGTVHRSGTTEAPPNTTKWTVYTRLNFTRKSKTN